MLNKIPLGIGGLTGLRTLSKVIIDGGNGFKISELKGLSDLEGRLSIMGLDKVISPIQAEDAKLLQKKGLDDLVMEWSDDFDDSRNHMTEFKVLEGLRPPPKLRELEILFYGGTIFPSWVGEPSFNQLTKLTLRGCRRCTHLPTLGHLRSLETLHVEGMDGVKSLGLELLGPTDGIAFPSLEVLEISNMQGWERWSTRLDDNGGTCRSFPCLRAIWIIDCPKLVEVSIGLIPSLHDLRLEGCSAEVFKSMVSASSSIHELRLNDISCWSIESYNCSNSVELLDISYCDSLTSLTFSTMHELPSSLETLHVDSCDNLESISEKGFGILPLESLWISNCKNLKLFPHEHLESLTSLKYMHIYIIVQVWTTHFLVGCGLQI